MHQFPAGGGMNTRCVCGGIEPQVPVKGRQTIAGSGAQRNLRNETQSLYGAPRSGPTETAAHSLHPFLSSFQDYAGDFDTTGMHQFPAGGGMNTRSVCGGI